MTIDIGGSGLKAMLLDGAGKPVSERVRVVTPAIPTPRAVLSGLDELRKALPALRSRFGRIPGSDQTRHNMTAANLHPAWCRLSAQAELQKSWKKPVRVANDAAVQGYGAIKGDGVELGAYAWDRAGLVSVHQWAPVPGT